VAGHVDCRVQIAVQTSSTIVTGIDARTEEQFGFHHTTVRTCLRRGEETIYPGELSASPGNFVVELAMQLSEGSISDRPGQATLGGTAIAFEPASIIGSWCRFCHHAPDVQIFDDDFLKSGCEGCGDVMQMIRSKISRPGMQTRNVGLGFAPTSGRCLPAAGGRIIGSDLSGGFALQPGHGCCCGFQMPGCWYPHNFTAVRCCRHHSVSDTNINTDNGLTAGGVRPMAMLHRDRGKDLEAGLPPTAAVGNGCGIDFATSRQITAQPGDITEQMDAANAGNNHTSAVGGQAGTVLEVDGELRSRSLLRPGESHSSTSTFPRLRLSEVIQRASEVAGASPIGMGQQRPCSGRAPRTPNRAVAGRAR